MPTTITVSKRTRDRLMRLKIAEGVRTMDAVVQSLLDASWETRFLDASRDFRRRMDKLGLTPQDLHGDELLE